MLTPAGSACTGARLVWRSCRCGAAPCWARLVPTVLTVAQLCPSARRAAPGGLLREGVARRGAALWWREGSAAGELQHLEILRWGEFVLWE